MSASVDKELEARVAEVIGLEYRSEENGFIGWDWYVQDQETGEVYPSHTGKEQLEDMMKLITALKQELKQSLEAQLKKLADEYDLPSITTWKQGEFIDMPRYNIQGPAWKREQELRERTLVRPGGGTNNALFQVCGSRNDDNIVAYICAVPKAIEIVFQDKGDNRE